MERSADLQRAHLLLQHITAIVNAADPANLMHHAPEDEYSAEISEILTSYLRIGPQIDALTQSIQDTFDRCFGPSYVSAAKIKLIANRLCGVLPFIDADLTK